MADSHGTYALAAVPQPTAPEAATAKENKVVVTLRMSREGRDFIDAQAEKNGADDRTQQIKAMLAVAARHPDEVKRQIARAKQTMTPTPTE